HKKTTLFSHFAKKDGTKKRKNIRQTLNLMAMLSFAFLGPPYERPRHENPVKSGFCDGAFHVKISFYSSLKI
ncbi:hypothetical protein J2S09_003172, partial [Bacillus fengqiuensis]|nr:hypothetical protein [Bacillus fengqiuensis]